MYKINQKETKVEIELAIDAKEWEEGVQKVYETSKSKFNVVGFRKGHAPRKVIEQTYGDNVFFEDTVQYFLDKTLNEALNEKPELEPVAMPTTEFESFTPENGLKAKILFEIVPDFKLCEYKGAKIKVHSVEVSDEDVDHYIKHFLDSHAEYNPVERDVKTGDIAVIDFKGFIGDVAFEGGEGKAYPLEIGSHSFIDTFEDQLVGHKKGEKVDVSVTFPENYGSQELAGKKALFKVEIQEVKEKSLPELNDKFVADTTEFETVEEYRKSVFAHIQDMKNKDSENEIQHNIRHYLIDNTNVQIPEIMVENQVEGDMARMQQSLDAYRLTVEQYLASMGTTKEEYLKIAKERCLESLKASYIYRKVLEENKITLSPAEIREAAKGLASQEEIARKENELLLEKLYKHLKEAVEIEYVKD